MNRFDDYQGEMNGFDDLADDRIEALLEGAAPAEEDLALAAFLSGVRALGARPVPSDLVQGQVAMLVEARRLDHPPAAATPSPDGDTGLRVGKHRLRTPVRRVLATKAAAVVFATLLLGSGVAAAASGSLPAPVQQAVARVAAQVGIQIPGLAVDAVDADLPDPEPAGHEPDGDGHDLGESRAAMAEAYTDAVRQVVLDYKSALEEWTACVAANAAGRGETQSDESTRTEGAFDPTQGCDPRPELTVPDPVEFGLGGPPDEVPGRGRPDGVGAPEGVITGGPPESPGPPDDVGLPDGVGPPAEVGPAKNFGSQLPVGGPPGRGGDGLDDDEGEDESEAEED